MNIGTTLFIFAIGFTVYWAIKGRSEKFHKSKFGKIAIALFVLSIGAGMLDPSTNSSDGSSSTTQSQESHRSSSSTVKTPSVKKTKAESSSKRKAESSSENHVSKKAPSKKRPTLTQNISLLPSPHLLKIRTNMMKNLYQLREQLSIFRRIQMIKICITL